MRFPPRHALFSSLLLFCACAASPLGDPGWAAPASVGQSTIHAGPADRGAADASGRVSGGAHGFELRQDRLVDGVKIAAGMRLFGLEVRGRWVALPRYLDVHFWRSDFALVKRPGQEHWQRFDVATGTETPLPFTAMGWARQRCVGLAFARGYGVSRDPDDTSLLQVHLLDDDWQVVGMLRRVRPGSADLVTVPQPVETLAQGAYLVHHTGTDGKQFDVVYDRAGRPMSPELEPLLRLADGSEQRDLRFAVRAHPQRHLYWPLGADGTVQQKPRDLLGLRPVYQSDFGGYSHGLFAGWIAHFTDGDGERCAWYRGDLPFDPARAELAAVWAELDPQPKRRTDSSLCDEVFVARRRGDARYVVVDAHGQAPALPGVFESRERALQALSGANAVATAAYEQECRQYWADLRESEAREKRAAAEAYERWAQAKAAAEAARAAALSEVRTTIQTQGADAALAFARKAQQAGSDGWQAVLGEALLAAIDARSTAPTMQELVTASDHTPNFILRGRLRDELERRFGAELRALQAPTFQPMSAYFGSPSNQGSSSSASSAPVWTGPSVGDTLNHARWQSQLNFLSGQTSSYWGNNGVLRR